LAAGRRISPPSRSPAERSRSYRARPMRRSTPLWISLAAVSRARGVGRLGCAPTPTAFSCRRPLRPAIPGARAASKRGLPARRPRSIGTARGVGAPRRRRMGAKITGYRRHARPRATAVRSRPLERTGENSLAPCGEGPGWRVHETRGILAFAKTWIGRRAPHPNPPQGGRGFSRLSQRLWDLIRGRG